MFNLAQVAMLYLGVPYIYGGNCILTGVDCGGLVVECLRSVGLHGKSDLNAQMIYDKFKNNNQILGLVKENSILFFGKDLDTISHIGIAINGNQMVEAGGGDKRTKTVEIAAEMNAYVRVRPISWRKDFLTSINL